MKKDIHPKLFGSVIKCACGPPSKRRPRKRDPRRNLFELPSFFYREAEITGYGRRIERFKKKYGDKVTRKE